MGVGWVVRLIKLKDSRFLQFAHGEGGLEQGTGGFKIVGEQFASF